MQGLVDVINLRPYQEDALDSIFRYWSEEGGSPLVEAATGVGKSLIIAELCRRLVRQYDGFKIVIATHVKELVEQSFAELESIWPLAPSGIHSAGLGQRATRQQIIFAGIQTAWRNAEHFGSVDLLIVDEAHLIPRNANTMYGKFIAALRAANPDLRLAGFTATPYRLGSGRLDQGDGAMFDKIVFSYGIREGVKDGFLAPLTGKWVETGFDLSGVGKSGGEYIETQLQAAVDKDEITRKAVVEVVGYGRNRNSWLLFCSGVDHSYHVRDEVRRHGFSCETVVGSTPPGERADIFRAFKAGEIRALSGNVVFSTGFNAPNVDLIADLQPSMSVSRYVQKAGRGTRLFPGKVNCFYLDFARNVRTHGPVDQVKPPGEKTGGGIAPIKECPKCHSLLHASLMECPDCGHVFPPSAVSKLTAKASALAVMGDAPAEWVAVQARTFTMVYRPKDTALLQATFICGQVKHRAWFMPEYGGRKGNKANKFWLEHGGKTPCPRTADTWIRRQAELAPTSEINIKPDGARMKVLDSRAVLVMSVAAE